MAHGVAKVEAEVLANTQLKEELATRAQRRQARQTHEQQAAVAIQRHARGLLGRRQAREVRAEFFVMVRGRAIRRGKCEECGEQRAVLECRECQEDSAHFCPVCWVHVHSTRRRKAHVALPIAAPLPVPPPKTKEREPTIKMTPTRASEGADAPGRPGGVSIPRLALAAPRSEPAGGANGSRAVGNVDAGDVEDTRPAPLGAERATSEQATVTQLERASTATDQQLELQRKGAASNAAPVTQQPIVAAADAGTDVAAAVPAVAADAEGSASPSDVNAASVASDAPPASSAADVGEQTPGVAPAL